MGVRNISFSENFAYVLNGWSILKLTKVKTLTRKLLHISMSFQSNDNRKTEVKTLFKSMYN